MANKYSAVKTTVTFQHQDYEFPSKAEANYFVKLAERLRRSEIDKFKLQPQFQLTDSYVIATSKTASGKSTVTGLKYTPDFEYYENGKRVIVEVKGMKTASYQMRLKLFLSIAHSKYGVDTFIEVVGAKATQYECSSVNVKGVA